MASISAAWLRRRNAAQHRLLRRIQPGSLSNCSANTKDIWEGTLGFWYKPYNGPKGRLQFGMQYSYVTKTAWAGIGTKTPYPSAFSTPTAIDNMFFTSFRYYLP